MMTLDPIGEGNIEEPLQIVQQVSTETSSTM